MSDTESNLLWCCVQQAVLLRRVEAAMRLLQPVRGDIAMHEARYQRAIKEAGLEKEAAEIEAKLNGEIERR